MGIVRAECSRDYRIVVPTQPFEDCSSARAFVTAASDMTARIWEASTGGVLKKLRPRPL